MRELFFTYYQIEETFVHDLERRGFCFYDMIDSSLAKTSRWLLVSNIF